MDKIMNLRAFSDTQLLYSCEWIKIVNILYKALWQIVQCVPRHLIKLCLRRINKLTAGNPGEKERITNMWHSFFALQNDDTKFLMTKIFYWSGLLNEELVKLTLRFAQETNNASYRYWTAMDISFATFSSQNSLYRDFYEDRKELLYHIIQDCTLKIPQKNPSKNITETRLCIIAYMLSPTIFNSMQRVAVSVANAMNKRFDKVTVITIDSLVRSPNEKKCLRGIYYSSVSQKSKDAINAMFDKDIVVRYVDEGEYNSKYQQALDMIYDFNPDAIIDITDEFSALSYIYSQDYLTFYLALRGYNSSSFFSYFLGNDLNNGTKFNNKIQRIDWYLPEVPTKTVYPLSRKKFDRKDYNLTHENFIIITMSGNSCSDEMVDAVCSMLRMRSSFIWLLVGDAGTMYLHTNYSDLFKQKKIIELKFEEDLSGLCGMCDAVLRPNTTGGSGGIAIAAQQGLPIVMTNFVCDAMRWLGTDYSTMTNYAELCAELEHLCDDKNYYARRKKITLERVAKAIDVQQSWNNLADIIKTKINVTNKNDANGPILRR